MKVRKWDLYYINFKDLKLIQEILLDNFFMETYSKFGRWLGKINIKYSKKGEYWFAGRKWIE